MMHLQYITQVKYTPLKILFYAYFCRNSMIFVTKSCKTRHTTSVNKKYDMNEIKLPLIHVLSKSQPILKREAFAFLL